MSDYKREVYYLYNYENRHKKNNIGFARVEQFNGKCRVTIRIRVPSMNGKTLDICLFAREEGEIRFLPIGTMNINNTVGESRLMLDADNIAESGYMLKEMEGMVIYDSVKKFFGSEWKEEKIYFEEFTLLSPKRKHGCLENNTMTTQAEQNEFSKQKQVNGVSRETAEEQNRSVTEWQNEKQDKSMTEWQVVEQDKSVTGEQDRKQNKNISREESDVGQEKESTLRAAAADNVHMESGTEGEGKRETAVPFSRMSKRLPEIFYELPRMEPFEDDEITDCVKMEPQDIGRLPMESWFLANNSFLLHSYYSYRHLLLARKVCEDGVQYVLCAPGICQGREEVMAAMFGFSEFKPTKKGNDKKGEFGYWYMPVVVEEIG